MTAANSHHCQESMIIFNSEEVPPCEAHLQYAEAFLYLYFNPNKLRERGAIIEPVDQKVRRSDNYAISMGSAIALPQCNV